MYSLCLILLSFALAIILFNLFSRKYVSPYTFTLVFGKKGSGKSCSMQKDIKKHHKLGWHIYADSNTNLPYVKMIDARQIYSYKFPRNSLICIDEINLLWDNRDFKTFDKRIQNWFREQRKIGVKVIAYSQTFDCDKKLRDLADRLAIQKKFCRLWTTRRYYVKTPRVISAEDTHDNSRIVDDYLKVPFIFKGLDLTFIPYHVKSYDTNETNSERFF